jgi:hypothetical protein
MHAKPHRGSTYMCRWNVRASRKVFSISGLWVCLDYLGGTLREGAVVCDSIALLFTPLDASQKGTCRGCGAPRGSWGRKLAWKLM